MFDFKTQDKVRFAYAAGEFLQDVRGKIAMAGYGEISVLNFAQLILIHYAEGLTPRQSADRITDILGEHGL